MIRKIIYLIVRKIFHTFWYLHKPLVKKNIKYKDIHKGETCLIFGNGASLKYYDFKVLPKIPAIACNFSPIDKRMKDVDFRYWVLADSYGFYPYYYHLHSHSFRENFFIVKGKSLLTKNQDKIIFTSITSLYAPKKGLGELVYFNHYGDKKKASYDLAGSFTISKSSLHAMIGVAKYMGFKKVILLGCDYLGLPKLEGHFYSDRVPAFGEDSPEYQLPVTKLLQSLGLEIVLIFPKGIKNPDFPSYSFEEYFGTKDKYQENIEFIDPEFLRLMREAAKVGQVYM
ncbi:MAG: hypothetical protein HS129_07055 [Leptospiraceae bacterium]|nr:hypothetical protein [Leptospiraceae bacterium]